MDGQDGGKIPAAKGIDGEQAAFVVNDVIAMRMANSWVPSNRLSLICSGGHSSGGWFRNKSEQEK
jgi:hypothetical protein